MSEFRPDWCLAPAETLLEWMGGQMTPGQLARQAGRGESDIKALLCVEDVLARRPLKASHAEVLERGTGITARFWLALEHNYRAGLAAGLTDASEGVTP